MNRSYNPETASAFLKAGIRQRIGRYLPGDFMRTNRSRYEEALNRISIEAWRYSESSKDRSKFPSDKAQRINLEAIRDRLESLRDALRGPDTETYRRLYQQLGQKHSDDHYQEDSDGAFNPIEDEIDEYNDGKRQYEQLETQLGRLLHAAHKVIARLPNRRTGRRAKTAPPLETSYAHALAEIWCQLSGEPFVAAAEVVVRKKTRENQRSSRFLEVVLRETIPGIDDDRLKRLIKKVGEERRDEPASARTGRRDKSGRGARSHY